MFQRSSRIIRYFVTGLPAVGLIFGGLWLSGCGESEPPYHVVVVTFDTTRADYLEVYGGPAPTPHLMALAEEGLVFEQAISPVPITLPSHSSLMTGKVPFAHGVRDNGLFELGESQTTLAEILKDRGYATGAAIGAFPLTSQFGIDQGFDFYDDHLTATLEDLFGERAIPKRRLYFDERPAGLVNEAIYPWLAEVGSKPVFLWAHYFDPHYPHTPPAPFDQVHAHDLYAGEIAYADQCLGDLIEALREHGLYDRTILVVTSDHGESRFEHNEATHSLLAYNSTLHIPLVIKPPADVPTGRRIRARVGLVDVMPTLLDWLDLPIPDDLQGRSLASDVSAPQPELEPRVVYAETLSPRISHGWGELRALYVDELKYIHGPRPELYDLEADPKELDDLVDLQADEAAEMERKLQVYLERNAVPGLDASVAIDEETAQRLMALGYVQSAGTKLGVIEEKLTREGDAPQDRAVTIGMYSQAKQFLFEGRWLDGREYLERLLRLDPDNGHYKDLLAMVETRLGNVDRAREILESIPFDALVPPRAQILESLGSLLLTEGKSDEALARFRDAEALVRTAEGQWRIAELYRQLDDLTQHERHLRSSLEEDEAFVPARLSLGILEAQKGESDLAEASFVRALEDHPYFPRSHFNYCAFLWGQSLASGDTDTGERAVEHCRRAVQLSPAYLQARSALVEMLSTLGREEEAVEEYLELVDRGPGSRYTEQAAVRLGFDL
ncbi:MAG: sulfatase-like hydrolase/transferase [Thermoanaerobaculia bacterium]|nr:sulfatase-like hydrolase/transferase [Thermoanaerobaculia bacterium]